MAEIGGTNTITRAHVVVDADLTRLRTALLSIKAQFVALGESLKGAMMNILGAGFAVGLPLFGILKSGLTEMAEISRTMGQMQAVLDSTRHAAGLTKDELVKMAEALRNATTFDEKEILDVQNLLLTFTDVGKEVFGDTIRTILNAAIALRRDAKEIALQIGRAVNDPTRGAGMLGRQGINFSKQQMAEIKALQSSGDLLGAQRYLLTEIEKQLGGSAEAFAKTFGGKIAIMKRELQDIRKAVVRIFFDEAGAERFVDKITQMALATQKFIDTNREMIRGILRASAYFVGLGVAVWTTMKIISIATNPIWMLGIAILSLLDAFGVVDTGMRSFTNNFFVAGHSLYRWWDSIIANLTIMWLKFLKMLANNMPDSILELSFGKFVILYKGMLELVHKMGGIDDATYEKQMKNIQAYHEKTAPKQAALAKSYEEQIRAIEDRDVKEFEKDSARYEEIKKKRDEWKKPEEPYKHEIQPPPTDISTMDKIKEKVTGVWGYMRYSEHIGEASSQVSLSRQQVELLKKTNTLLETIAGNTEEEAAVYE